MAKKAKIANVMLEINLRQFFFGMSSDELAIKVPVYVSDLEFWIEVN